MIYDQWATMRYDFRSLGNVSVLLASALIAGCEDSARQADPELMVSFDQGKTWQPSTSAPNKEGKEPPALTRSQLMTLNLGYSNFCATYGRAPGNIEEFAPLLVATVYPESARQQEEECLAHLKQGKYDVMWNHDDVFKAADDTYIVTAYESRTVKEGGFVVFADHRIEWMTPDEFAKATARRAPQKPSEADAEAQSPK